MATSLRTLTRPAILAALQEFKALGREAFLAKYKFSPARDYFLRDPVSGDLCDSKAIVGAAFAFQQEPLAPLKPEDFSGGAKTVEVLLERLGFEIIRLSQDEDAAPGRPIAWNLDEVRLVVADYLDMLVLDLSGQKFNKAERRRRLLPLLQNRTEASVEFKRRNISAVLEDLGVPSLRGYLRASNVQGSLVAEVEAQLRARTELDEAARFASERPLQLPDALPFERMLTSAPERQLAAKESAPAYLRSPIKRDYFEREASNRKIGKAGEELVLHFERWRLLKLGLGQLAERVEHVSVSQGDGLGYDVLSFDSTGEKKFVEVKTTAFSQTTPFFVSANEARFAREHKGQFSLYRVFDFRSAPKLFELRGAIEGHCHLDPSSYRASFQ